MKQLSFTDIEYGGRKRVTKREAFLDKMDTVIDWDMWTGLIAPHYYCNKVGRRAVPLETMLRMYLLQCWYNLSDEGCEDQVNDSYAMRKFMKIDFLTTQCPDATTLCKFRTLLSKNGIERKIREATTEQLEENGMIMKGGSIVDASIIDAPMSTKNENKERDPEMSHTRKGSRDWHFGMKVHIGADAGSGLIHSVEVSTAKEHDIVSAHKLIREDDAVVYGDCGYRGIEKRAEVAESEHLSQIEYRISERVSALRKLTGLARTFEGYLQWRKSAVRYKVEYAFLMIKRRFGYRKTRYRGLQKNESRLNILAVSANLVMLAQAGRL
jgi:IS5 family transposase